MTIVTHVKHVAQFNWLHFQHALRHSGAWPCYKQTYLHKVSLTVDMQPQNQLDIIVQL